MSCTFLRSICNTIAVRNATSWMGWREVHVCMQDIAPVEIQMCCGLLKSHSVLLTLKLWVSTFCFSKLCCCSTNRTKPHVWMHRWICTTIRVLANIVAWSQPSETWELPVWLQKLGRFLKCLKSLIPFHQRVGLMTQATHWAERVCEHQRGCNCCETHAPVYRTIDRLSELLLRVGPHHSETRQRSLLCWAQSAKPCFGWGSSMQGQPVQHPHLKGRAEFHANHICSYWCSVLWWHSSRAWANKYIDKGKDQELNENACSHE